LAPAGKPSLSLSFQASTGPDDCPASSADPPLGNPFVVGLWSGQGPNSGALPATPTGYLTVKVAAARLSVSTAMIYKLIEAGKLPHRRIGNSIRIAVEDLESAFNRGCG